MALKTDAALRKDIRAGTTKMEHRHFATIATIIREMQEDVYSSHEVAAIFADRLCDQNPRFDRRRFMLACGFEA